MIPAKTNVGDRKQLLEGYNLYPTQKNSKVWFLKKKKTSSLYQSHEGKGEINPTESQGQWDLELVFRYFLISRQRFLSDRKWNLPCISTLHRSVDTLHAPVHKVSEVFISLGVSRDPSSHQQQTRSDLKAIIVGTRSRFLDQKNTTNFQQFRQQVWREVALGCSEKNYQC